MWPQLELKHGLGPNIVAPFAFARSAIFSSQVYRRHADRPHYTASGKLVATDKLEIYQTAGYQLDQGDADVLYELIRHVFRQGDADRRESRVCFNRRQMLAALGRTHGGKTRALLDASIERLYAASFEFRIPGLITGMSRLLLSVLRREDSTNQEHDYEVLIDVRLAQLFNQGRWALLRKSEREKLAGDPLAKGLHAYFSTHRDPYPIKQETLKSLTGRGSMQESKWRAVLRDSLERLKHATGWYICELVTSGKNAGMVVVVRAAPKQSKQGKTTPSPTSAATGASSLETCLSPLSGLQTPDEDYDDI